MAFGLSLGFMGLGSRGAGGASPISASFPVLRAAYASGQAIVSLIGDSTGGGLGSGSLVGTFLWGDANTTGWATRTAVSLEALGANAMNACASLTSRNLAGLTLAQQMQYYDPDVTVGAGWTAVAVANTYGPGMYFNNSTTNPITWTPGVTFDRVEIAYPINPGLGTLGVNIGGAVQNVSQTKASSPGGFQRTTLTFARGASTLNFARVSGGVYAPLGVRVWDSAAGSVVQMETCSIPGGTTASFAVSTADLWSPLQSMARLGSHLYVVNLGLNDKVGGRTTAQFKTDLKTILNNCLATGADVRVCVPVVTNSAHSFDAAWIATVGDAASECGIPPPIDMHAAFGGSAAAALAAGYISSDNVHPSAAGYAQMGSTLAAALAA